MDESRRLEAIADETALRHVAAGRQGAIGAYVAQKIGLYLTHGSLRQAQGDNGHAELVEASL
ncbi:MAG: hypothetical protein ACREP1_12980, partial [Rhodanobacteraceae bacterium]